MPKKIIIIILSIAVLLFLGAGIFYLIRQRQKGVTPAVSSIPANQEQPPSIEIPDLDYDGLINEKEKEIGTDPNNQDTDEDGLTDGKEIKLGRNPLVKDFNLGEADGDEDGLTDDEEKLLGLDPGKRDTDGDGFSDGLEFDAGTDFLDPEKFPLITPSEFTRTIVDSDGDGLSDEDEKFWGTNPQKKDTDGDELNDYDEVRTYFTDPLNPDTDGDGFKDGQEVKAGYNPKGEGRL